MSEKKTKKALNTILINTNELPLNCPREEYLKLSKPKLLFLIQTQNVNNIKYPYL